MRSAGESSPNRSSWGRGSRRTAIWATVALGVMGCDGMLKNDELPPNVADPALTFTPRGALAVYRGVQSTFQSAFGGPVSGSGASSFVAVTGVLADELNTRPSTIFPNEDSRLLPEPGTYQNSSANYSSLQKIRGQANQAIGLLRRYVPEDSALAGHAYALEGYAEVFLAELFCSGIPLSTLDFDGDFTYQAGSTTTQVLTHAVALFDSALALAGDSTRFLHLAAVGKARALLGLGAYAQAAAAVAAVPDVYTYQVSYTSTVRNFAVTTGTNWGMTVAEAEGGNGLDYRTANDPRLAIVQLGTATPAIWRWSKYATDGLSPIVLASGVEARLIEAEAALQASPADDQWLAKLNALRTAGLATAPPDTIRDTLGITGCSTTQLCGTDGVSGGTFVVPAGYTLTDSVTITLTLALRTRCRTSSAYAPCFATPATTLVRLYVGPFLERWSAGIGGVADLAPLDDPGTSDPDARVDLLFRERAFWLFLSGHRQGDLRRLIRQYGRGQGQVYPIGAYPYPSVSGAGTEYGGDVDVPIPSSERLLNPLFTGCAARGA